MPLRWPFSRLNNFISIWHRIICNSNSKCSTLHHQLSSLFVTEAMFGLRESTLLNIITVKMSVLLGCQHGVYAMSFAASVTSYYIHYVMKCFTSVIYMWTRRGSRNFRQRGSNFPKIKTSKKKKRRRRAENGRRNGGLWWFFSFCRRNRLSRQLSTYKLFSCTAWSFVQLQAPLYASTKMTW